VNLLFCWKWIKPWVDWCSVNFWAQTVYGQVPFVLVESEAHRHPHRQGEAVFVHVNMDGSQHSLPLVTVFYQLHPVPASSYTFLQAMFGRRYPVCNCLLTIAYTILCTLLFLIPFQVIQHLMTIPVSLQVGLLDEEKILPLGREITAVGVVNTSSDGSPVIKSCNHLPVFLTQYTRDQLLAELSNGTKVLFWMGIAFSTVAAGVLCYSIVKNWAKWKQRQQRQQQRPQQDDEARHTMSTEEEPENSGDIPDEDLCVVCLLRRRQAAFIQCGHRVCCVPCAQRVEQGSNPLCPVCRQIVTSIVRVFDS
jgi:E3 ubiquitin-protein ligase MUL1